ncbi:hypothetical protein EZJ43_07900 [Pedobacter changchengzhani]|uniref:Lipoprotein n=1 Tax=Pedobacter changchengzhani TaxID=2529274 RepID=A0A4V6PJ90_9SPHI|nr:hypothetical protein [Pedobacter changchengzhani]TDG36433.1 hypothetical protein EZJ43_07900 [Pedobacter changchengzhani]
MKKLIYLLPILFFISCQENRNTSSTKQSEVKTSLKRDAVKKTKAIPFKKTTNEGVLIGKDIKLLDERLNEIKDISFMNGQIIQVIGVSDSTYKANPKDEYCQEFKYVKVLAKGLEGVVEGRKVYQLLNDEQNKTVKIEGNEISFTPTQYYGIGVADDNGLTGCQTRSPVIFSDKNAQYKGLVRMIKNKYVYDDYPYFELKADDGNYDEIIGVKKQDGKYILEIKTDFQEGIATMIVAIYKNTNSVYVAEIIKSSAVRTSKRNK